MTAWYDLPASDYARGLRFYADRSDEVVKHKEASRDNHVIREAEHFRRQARRLRAMATLCDRQPDARAGSIDFRGLQSPRIKGEDEDAIVSAIEAEAKTVSS